MPFAIRAAQAEASSAAASASTRTGAALVLSVPSTSAVGGVAAAGTQLVCVFHDGCPRGCRFEVRAGATVSDLQQGIVSMAVPAIPEGSMVLHVGCVDAGTGAVVATGPALPPDNTPLSSTLPGFDAGNGMVVYKISGATGAGA